MKNIHITLTEFRNETRILKEISSLSSFNLFDSFCVIALGAEDLKKKENFSDNFIVQRIRLRSRSLPKSAPFQLFKFFEFMFKCFLIINREKPAFINVHTLALLPLGWFSKLLFKSKLVYDTHELETEKNGLHGVRKKISKRIERLLIRYCDIIIVVGDHIADWYKNEYNIKRPLVVKNAPRLQKRAKNNLFRKKMGIKNEQKILLYQGGLMKGRGVQLILDAFKARTPDDVVAVFMGYGELENKIKDAAASQQNIKFFPAVQPQAVLAHTTSADFGIHLIQNTCLNHYYCLPNKLFEYAMAGLPVLVSDMKEMADADVKF